MGKGSSITSDFDVQVNFLFALLKKGRMPRSYLRQGLHIVKIFRGQKDFDTVNASSIYITLSAVSGNASGNFDERGKALDNTHYAPNRRK